MVRCDEVNVAERCILPDVAYAKLAIEQVPGILICDALAYAAAIQSSMGSEHQWSLRHHA